MPGIFEQIGRIEERRSAAKERGQDPDNPKKYNILFIGAGGVAQQGINFLASNPNMFLFDIGTIYVANRAKKGSVQKREKLLRDARTISRSNNANINFKSRNIEELSDLLTVGTKDQIDIAFFTLDKNSKEESNRTKLSAKNIELIEQIAEYVQPDFAGNFNIISNLPEVLAAKATELFPIDARQISASVPLDVLRGESYLYENCIRNKIEDFSGFELALAGFHDQMIPFLKHSRIRTSFTVGTNKIKQNHQPFSIEQHPSLEDNLRTFIKNDAPEIYSLYKAYLLAMHYNTQEGATIQETGAGILRLTQAIINRKKTVLGIPKEIKGTWYYVQLPVTFQAGYPQEDIEITSTFTSEEKRKIEDVICAQTMTGFPKSLSTIIAETEIATKKIIFRPPEATPKELEAKFGKTSKEHIGPEAKNDLEEKDLYAFLQRNLSMNLGFISETRPQSFYFFSYDHSMQPAIVKNYQLQLNAKTYELKQQLIRRTMIKSIRNDDEELFVIARTKSKQDPNLTLRIQRFLKYNGATGTELFTIQKPSTYDIEDFLVQKNKFYILASNQNEEFLEVFNSKGKQRQRITVPETIFELTSYKNKPLLIGEHTLYQLNGKKLVSISPNNKGANSLLLPDKNILLTTTRNEANIINLEKGDIITQPTNNYNVALVDENKNIQLVTDTNDGFLVQDFKNTTRLFQKKGEERMLQHRLILNPQKIFAPAKDILVTFHRGEFGTGSVYVTGHMKNNPPIIKKLYDIKDDYYQFGGFIER